MRCMLTAHLPAYTHTHTHAHTHAHTHTHTHTHSAHNTLGRECSRILFTFCLSGSLPFQLCNHTTKAPASQKHTLNPHLHTHTNTHTHTHTHTHTACARCDSPISSA